MKNNLFFLLILLVVGVFLYMGYILVVQKSLKTSTPQTDQIENPQSVIQKQKEEIETVWEKQRRMMEEQKQRIRDVQHR